jgi:hypothetical protein
MNRRGVEVVRGRGRFAGPNAVAVDGEDPGGQPFVIATGSKPRRLPLPSCHGDTHPGAATAEDHDVKLGAAMLRSSLQAERNRMAGAEKVIFGSSSTTIRRHSAGQQDDIEEIQTVLLRLSCHVACVRHAAVSSSR